MRSCALLFERTLADRERVLGADHPDTITTSVALATLSRKERRLPGAAGTATGAVSANAGTPRPAPS